jgi:hypothetical protein
MESFDRFEAELKANALGLSRHSLGDGGRSLFTALWGLFP